MTRMTQFWIMDPNHTCNSMHLLVYLKVFHIMQLYFQSFSLNFQIISAFKGMGIYISELCDQNLDNGSKSRMYFLVYLKVFI